MTRVGAVVGQARGVAAGAVARNLSARIGALAALSLSTVIVAHTAGAAGLGAMSLLRVLPWLVGVVLGGGLYGAAPYFLSGPPSADPRYRATFPAIAVAAGVAGIGVWLLVAPLLHHRFFPQVSLPVLLLAAGTVMSQLVETTSKACSQGTGDMVGSNRVIVLEELLFVPAYVLLLAVGLPHYLSMVLALMAGDAMTATTAWSRLARRGFFRGSRPGVAQARAIVGYGVRSELGSIVLLLNARLDFAIVASLRGPADLGIYSVASRYAELLRLPGLAMNYVLYPEYARSGAGSRARSGEAVRRVGWVPAALAVPLAAAAPWLLPLVYGHAFRAGVVPTWILLGGLAGGGVQGVVMAYLSADGRPGVSSACMAAGLVVTVGLDLTLIPRWGITGAAVASCAAYLTTTALLLATFRAAGRRPVPPTPVPGTGADRNVSEVYG